MDEEVSCNIELGIDDIYLLYDCVCRRMESWEDAPTPHPFEKEHLHHMKDWLYRMILDYKFHFMDSNGGT